MPTHAASLHGKSMVGNKDIWYQWLLHRRFGVDPKQMQDMADLHAVRDEVLSHANLDDGDVLLDVGCGDGLIAFGALEKTKTGRVLFSDISQDLLEHARSIAEEMGVSERCEFLRASADDLSAIEESTVDVVTTRSVLIYVSNKQQAVDEFHRVLKPNGRLSIFEPINRFGWPEPPHLFWGYDVTPVMETAQKVKALYHRLQPVETDPMMNFDERDLMAFAEQAGFGEIHLELRAEISPADEKASWEAYFKTAGNPKIPTLEEAIQQTLTPEEAEKFIAHLRPLVEGRQQVRRWAGAYLWAVKH